MGSRLSIYVTHSTEVETEIHKTITATKASGYTVTYTTSNYGKTVHMGQKLWRFSYYIY